MMELLQLAFAPANIFFTLLLLVVLFYWLTVIVGLLDLSFLDFDLDVDVDADAHVHVDKGMGLDVDTGGGSLGVVLAYFNFGSVPFMILVSFIVLFTWVGSILGNYYLSGGAGWISLLLVVPNLLISLFLTKFITQPLKWVFREEEERIESNHAMIGRTCTVLLTANDQKPGQAEVAIQKGAPLLLTVKTTAGNKLSRGEKGLIIDYDKNAHTYLIEPYDVGTPGSLPDRRDLRREI